MVQFDRLKRMKVHDEVAVLRPSERGPQLVEITQVKHVGHVLIQTDDNQFYSAYDGESIVHRRNYIEPATTAHRKALR